MPDWLFLFRNKEFLTRTLISHKRNNRPTNGKYSPIDYLYIPASLYKQRSYADKPNN